MWKFVLLRHIMQLQMEPSKDITKLAEPHFNLTWIPPRLFSLSVARLSSLDNSLAILAKSLL